MKRVCIDARMIDSGGIGSYLQAMIKTLLAKKIEVVLLIQREKRSLIKESPVIFQDFNAKIFSLKEQLLFPFIVPVCDLFFSPHVNVPFLPLKAKKRHTVIHDLYHLEHPTSFFQKFFSYIYYQAAARLSNKLITVSFFSQSVIKWKLKKASTVIYPAIFPHFFSAKNQKKEIILAVGNIKPHKNLLALVKAFELLETNYELFLVGKKEGMRTIDQDLIRYIAKKERIHLLGYIENKKLLELYQEAALFVCTSKYEGFGLPAVEAMACGCPVIASKKGAIYEVLGDAAYYTDCDDPQAIAKSITVLLKKENRQEWIIRGKKRALLYTIERFQQDFCAFCEKNSDNL